MAHRSSIPDGVTNEKKPQEIVIDPMIHLFRIKALIMTYLDLVEAFSGCDREKKCDS